MILSNVNIIVVALNIVYDSLVTEVLRNQTLGQPHTDGTIKWQKKKHRLSKCHHQREVRFFVSYYIYCVASVCLFLYVLFSATKYFVFPEANDLFDGDGRPVVACIRI